MDKMKYTLRLLGGVTLFLVCGCHSPYSYQPYGYTGAPGFYPPQQQPFPGAYPGGVYPGAQPGIIGGGGYPGTTFPGNPGGFPGLPGQPLVPDTTTPGTTFGDPMYVPSTGDEWNPVPSDTLDGGYGGTYSDDNIEHVPQPKDPGESNFFEDDLGRATDSFGSAPDDSIGFEQPVAARRPVSPVYGFDEVEYRWLKGILKRDSETDSWRIVYDLDGRDRFGGDLLVGRDARFNESRDGDLFELKGYLDKNATGPDGDPVYRVTAAKIFKPKQIQ